MSSPNKVSATKVDEDSYKSDYFRNIVSQMNKKLQNKENQFLNEKRVDNINKSINKSYIKQRYIINNEGDKKHSTTGDTAPVDSKPTQPKESSTGDNALSTSGDVVTRKSHQPTGEIVNQSGVQPTTGSDSTNIQERKTPHRVEKIDHGKNFQKAPTGEHSPHLAQGAGGLITYKRIGHAQVRGDTTGMISASRSTIQDPEVSKNVCILETMTSK